MLVRRHVAAFLCSVALASGAHAQTAHSTQSPARENPSSTLRENAERGWFFYERDKKPREEPAIEMPELPPAAEDPPPPKEERCKKKETWSADCGFVDPGKDFEFQAKQRDALLQAMAMSRNDPKAVENFQYYMKWLMERSVEVANLWHYNMVQNPELDPTVKSPISTFGLRLMTQVRDSSDEAILSALKDEGAFLVYFSRYDCDFCHAMTSVLEELGRSTGLTIWNAPLDTRCMPRFEAHCRGGAQTIAAAQALQVSIVPTLFLYVPGPKAEDDTWIRIATGVTDASTMRGRIVAFFSAYRMALLKGVANGGPNRAPVDFSDITPTGIAPGVPLPQTGQQTPPLPTEQQIRELFSR